MQCYIIICTYRVHGYKGDSLHTYGMVSGLLTCGFAFGAMTGPVIGGALTDLLDFAWMTTILGFVSLFMVSAEF